MLTWGDNGRGDGGQIVKQSDYHYGWWCKKNQLGWGYVGGTGKPGGGRGDGRCKPRFFGDNGMSFDRIIIDQDPL
jgi:hypothetical protein